MLFHFEHAPISTIITEKPSRTVVEFSTIFNYLIETDWVVFVVEGSCSDISFSFDGC